MKIGELARRTGCKPVTIRFYEKKGLMPKTSRTEGNYRNYDEKDFERLFFIRHCRRHVMNLEEIERLLRLSADPDMDHGEIHEIIKSHIVNIQQQIMELCHLKAALEAMLGACEGKGEQCGILTSLAKVDLCSFCRMNHNE